MTRTRTTRRSEARPGHRTLALSAVAVALAAFLPECGSGGSKQKVYDPPVIAIQPADREVFVPTSLGPGDTWPYDLCIGNTVIGSLLTVTSVTIEQALCPGDPEDTFTLTWDEGLAFPVAVVGPGDGATTGKPEFVCVRVTYTAPDTVCARSATVHILSDTRDAGDRDLAVRFTVAVPTPHIVASPPVVDLGMVEVGQSVEAALAVRNTGLGDLVVSAVRYKGSAGFSFTWRCRWAGAQEPEEPIEKWVVVPGGADPVTMDDSVCAEPLTIPANGEYKVRVRYEATNDLPAKAFVTFLSNDPDHDAAAGEGVDVEFWANVSGPCLRATPEKVAFGTVVKNSFHAEEVELFSCGDKTVQVTSIALQAGAQSPFRLDLQGVGTPSEAQPLVLNPGDRKTFMVTYLPEAVKTAPDGTVLADEDTIRIANSSPRPDIAVPVSGMAVEGQKPVCEFKITSPKEGEVEDGGVVLVLDRLSFYDQSYDPMPGGGVVAWEWSATTPPGSADIFQPSYTFPTPTFEVNVVGDYLFCLKVFNTLGISSDQCCKLVHVKAGEGCVVELTWETPLDPDPTDQCGTGKNCGSDMDLHIVHRYAGGPDVDKDGKPDGFFDKKWDCFWFNPRPIWVEGGDPVLDQPRLDRDDTDGAGPENFHYDQSPPGECYKVGVHYWDDHTFGASIPTLRVFLDGDLKYEKKAPKMKMQDLWEAGEVCCSNPDKPFIEYQVGGAPVIIPKYVNPDFNFNP